MVVQFMDFTSTIDFYRQTPNDIDSSFDKRLTLGLCKTGAT